MHEYDLAEAVAATALNVAEQESLVRVTAIAVRVGELQSISIDLMRTALGEVLPAGEPRLAGVAIDVAIEPARFSCRVCAREFGLADAPGFEDRGAREAAHFVPELAHAFVGCPGCGSADFEVTAGRGVAVASIESEAA